MFGHTPPKGVPLATTVSVVTPPPKFTLVEMLPFDQIFQPVSCAPPVECVIASASKVPGVHVPPLDAPPLDAPPLDVPPLDVPPLDVQPLDVPPLDVPPLGVPPLDVPPVPQARAAPPLLPAEPPLPVP